MRSGSTSIRPDCHTCAGLQPMSPLNRIVQSSSMWMCFTMNDSPSMTTRSNGDPDFESLTKNASRWVAPASNSSSEDATGRGVSTGAATSISISRRFHLCQQLCRPSATTPHVVADDLSFGVEVEHVHLPSGERHTVFDAGNGELDDFAARRVMAPVLFEHASLAESAAELLIHAVGS